MSTNIHDDVGEAVETLLGEADGAVIAVGPSGPAFESLVETATRADAVPELRVLGDASTLKDVLEDFAVASVTADLIEDDVLDLRDVAAPPAHDVAVTDGTVAAVVETDASTATLETDDESFVGAAGEYYEDAFAQAEAYSLRTPPLSRVRETLAEEFGDEIRGEFDAALESADAIRGEVDAVTLCLLLAARNEVQLYRISTWGEDVGLASRATFSRRKTELEEMGLLDTESVPMDVGRPRLRLLPGHEDLREAGPEDLPDVARRLIES